MDEYTTLALTATGLAAALAVAAVVLKVTGLIKYLPTELLKK